MFCFLAFGLYVACVVPWFLVLLMETCSPRCKELLVVRGVVTWWVVVFLYISLRGFCL